MNPAGLLKENPCVVCQSREKKFLFVRLGEAFVRCLECGLIYKDPPPEEEEVQTFYEKNYYENFGDLNLAIQKARLSLYRDALDRSERVRLSGRLLDVGSGYGDFLRLAEERGWEAWGIEPSETAREIGGGPRVLNQTVESSDFPGDHFDLISLWNVLDCLPHPRRALEKIRGWLRPGGLLVIRTPNSTFHVAVYRFYVLFHSFLEFIGWEKDTSVFHRANFDRKTLTELLHHAGFCGIEVRNGVPTQGDAYQVSPRAHFVERGKQLVHAFASLMEFLSGGRWLTGSTLMAFSSKDGTSARPSGPLVPGTPVRIFLKRVMLHLLALLGYLLGLPLWSKLCGKGREVRVLHYHCVSERRRSDENVTESQFRKQMDFLQGHYSLISLAEAVASLEKEGLPSRPSAALTFDDGYQDNYEIVYPLLRERKIPVTIFLLTGGEGEERRLSFMVEGGPQERLLSWEEVRRMAASGAVEFGSHGQSHSPLADLSSEKLAGEVRGSKEKIESETSLRVSFFSYPFGTRIDFDSRVKAAVKQAGYRAAFLAVYGTNGPGADPFLLRRIGIEASDTLFTFRAKLNGALGLLQIFSFPFVRRLIRWFDIVILRRTLRTRKTGPPLLLISVDFPPHTDGVSTISREMCRRIAERGRRVRVVGPSDRGDRAFDRAQPYPVHRVPGYEWGYLRFLPLLIATPWVVLRHGIRKIFAMNIAYGGILAWALSFFLPLEYVIFSYGYEFEKVRSVPLAWRLYLSIYRRARQIVACSQLVKERLVRFGAPPEKIEVLYPAVDLERFKPGKVPADFLEKKGIAGKKILLTVGRLIERKGHDLVFRALPEVLRVFPDVLYCIVGIGEQENQIRELVRSLGLEDSVRFLGKIPDEELVQMYRAASVFVMPSREIEAGGHIEGFGIVYLEANACGRPVIGGRSGGVVEAIREGETGLLVDPSNPRELAEKVLYLLSHPREAEALGGQGLHWVRQTFNWDRYTEEAYRLLSGEDLP